MSDTFGGLIPVLAKPLISLFSPDKPKPLPERKPIPSPDDEAVRRAKAESLMKQRARGGRASTILSDRETLG